MIDPALLNVINHVAKDSNIVRTFSVQLVYNDFALFTEREIRFTSNLFGVNVVKKRQTKRKSRTKMVKIAFAS